MLPLRFECGEPLVFQPRSPATAVGVLEVEPIKVRSQLRVYTGAALDPLDCLIDTGATLSVFPYDIWQPLQSGIRWLEGVNPPAKLAANLRGIRGRGRHAQIGLVDVSIGGVDGQWSRRTPIVAKFASKSTRLNFKCVLLGMNGLQFEGGGPARQSRRFEIDFAARSAFLVANE